MNSERRRLTPQEKIAALKRHLLEGVPVSTICDELGIAPTLFYRWQKEFFENGAAAFQPKGRSNVVGAFRISKTKMVILS